MESITIRAGIAMTATKMVKHVVDDDKAEERTHPSYFSLPEQWEYHVQQIQNLGVGEAIIRLMDDSMHKLKTPRLPKLTVTRKQLQVIRAEYLTRYFVPVGIPAVHVPEVDLYPRAAPRVARRRGGFT
jgi:hypothetical protein